MTKLHFGYRIGRVAIGKFEDCDVAINAYGYQFIPTSQHLGVYAVLLDDQDNVIKTSKYPVSARYPGSKEKFQEELRAYSRADEYPIFDMDKFGAYDYILSLGGDPWSDQYVWTDQDILKLEKHCEEELNKVYDD